MDKDHRDHLRKQLVRYSENGEPVWIMSDDYAYQREVEKAEKEDRINAVARLKLPPKKHDVLPRPRIKYLAAVDPNAPAETDGEAVKAAAAYMRDPAVRRLTYTIQEGDREIGHYNDGLYKWSDADIDAVANGNAGVIPAFEKMVVAYLKIHEK
jgi:pyruvate/2-oxoacid:ferredoxin oxidoreductase alpha subunit